MITWLASFSSFPFSASSVSHARIIAVFFLKDDFFKILLILFFFFLATLGLRCCARALSSCRERGLLFIAAHGLRIAVASLVAEHGP